MNRDKWRVSYKGYDLKDAADKKLDFHTARRKWWMEKKEELIVKLKKEGISITESVVDEIGKAGYSVSNSIRGGRTVVEIDEGIQAQLYESTQKVHEHDGKIEQYRAWSMMAAAHDSTSFELDYDDWMFFFLEPRNAQAA